MIGIFFGTFGGADFNVGTDVSCCCGGGRGGFVGCGGGVGGGSGGGDGDGFSGLLDLTITS